MAGYILGTLVDYIFALPFFLLTEMALWEWYRRKGIRFNAGFMVGWQVYAYVVMAVLSVTGIDGIHWIVRYGAYSIQNPNVSLIPFVHAEPFGMIMNAVLFIPVGFLTPVLWDEGRKIRKTVPAGFLFSLMIEIVQLFCSRATDIDDLLMNTVGTLIGYGMYRLMGKLPWFRKMFEERGIFTQRMVTEDSGKAPNTGKVRWSPLVSIMLVFGVYVFLAEPWLDFLRGMMYGY